LGAQQLLRLFPGLPWDDVLALDPSSEDLTETVRAHVEQRLANTPNPLGLITLGEAAGLLSRTETQVRFCLDNQTEGFPVEATRLKTTGTRLLLTEDVREYARTGRASKRPLGELQDAAYDRKQAAEALGVTPEALSENQLQRRRQKFPLADGRAGHHWYWLPSTIETWVSSHPDKPGQNERNGPVTAPSARVPRP
jgi:hypothetical protein